MTPRSLLAPARLAGQPILRSQTDERLVDLVRAGSEPAFEAIVGRYRRPLLRYCGGILSGGRAEDAVQHTFVKAYDAMRRGDNELNLRPWLYRIAHNTALNGLRDKSLQDQPLDPELDGVERPDQAAERRQGVREVLAAVQALPTRQRDAIVLRELEGRSYEEIAGALGVTGGAVRQLLSRARTTLRTAATAMTPVGLLMRVPFDSASDSVSGRVAELVGGAGAGAAAKFGTAVLVTGAVAGGVAAVPAIKDSHPSQPHGGSPAQAARASDEASITGGGAGTGSGAPTGDRRVRGGGSGSGPRGRSGTGGHGRGEPGHEPGGSNDRRHGGDPQSGGDRRGSGGGGDDGGHSGSGGGGDSAAPRSGDDHSGPGSGTEQQLESSSGPGSGSVPSSGDGDHSGSGSGSGDGSGSGSGSGSGDSSGSGHGGDGPDPLPLPSP
jgi:RNA polymerase sigma factor (sigma-70 family)